MSLQPEVGTPIENHSEDVGIIEENSLEDPLIGRSSNGLIVSGTDKGYGYENRNANKENEDGGVIDLFRNCYAKVDALGGSSNTPGYYLRGDEARCHCEEALREGFAAGKSFTEVRDDMHRRMKEAQLAENGACFLAFRIEGKTLHLAYSGDVRLVIIGKDGKVRYQTKPNHEEENHDFVKGPVTGLNPGELMTNSLELQEGDRILAYSDGIDENLTPEQISGLIIGKSVEEAFKILADETERLMRSGQGKSDNRTLLIFDLQTPR